MYGDPRDFYVLKMSIYLFSTVLEMNFNNEIRNVTIIEIAFNIACVFLYLQLADLYTYSIAND